MRNAQFINAEFHTNVDDFCKLLSEHYKLRTISVPHLLHAEMNNNNNNNNIINAADKIRKTTANKQGIPTAILDELIRKEIELNDSDILFLNYPRTENQIYDLTALLNRMDIKIEKVWHLRLLEIKYTYDQLYTEYLVKYKANFTTWSGTFNKHRTQINRIINLWKKSILPTIVNVDHKNNKDLLTYFKNQIDKSA